MWSIGHSSSDEEDGRSAAHGSLGPPPQPSTPDPVRRTLSPSLRQAVEPLDPLGPVAPGVLAAPMGEAGVPEAPAAPGASAAGRLASPPAGTGGAPRQSEVLHQECSEAERRKYQETRAKLAAKEKDRRRHANQASGMRDPEMRAMITAARAKAKAKAKAKARGEAEPEAEVEGMAEAEVEEGMGPDMLLALLAPKPKKKQASGGAKKARAKAKAAALAAGGPGVPAVVDPPAGRGRQKKEKGPARPRRSRVSVPCAPSIPVADDPGAPGILGADEVPGVSGVPEVPGAGLCHRRPHGTVGCFAGRPPPGSEPAKRHFDLIQQVFTDVLPEGVNWKDGVLQRSCWKFVVEWLKERVPSEGAGLAEGAAYLEAAKEWALGSPDLRQASAKQKKEDAVKQRLAAAAERQAQARPSGRQQAVKRPAGRGLEGEEERGRKVRPAVDEEDVPVPAPRVDGPGVPGVNVPPSKFQQEFSDDDDQGEAVQPSASSSQAGQPSASSSQAAPGGQQEDEEKTLEIVDGEEASKEGEEGGGEEEDGEEEDEERDEEMLS